MCTGERGLGLPKSLCGFARGRGGFWLLGKEGRGLGVGGLLRDEGGEVAVDELKGIERGVGEGGCGGGGCSGGGCEEREGLDGGEEAAFAEQDLFAAAARVGFATWGSGGSDSGGWCGGEECRGRGEEGRGCERRGAGEDRLAQHLALRGAALDTAVGLDWRFAWRCCRQSVEQFSHLHALGLSLANRRTKIRHA